MNCYYCKKWFSKKKDAVEHIEKYHSDDLIKDKLDACQALYLTTHLTLEGTCMCGCGKKTEWNVATGKPFKVSPDPACRARLKKIAEANLIRVHGVDQHTLMSDMAHQREMQHHRKITGKYQFNTDGGFVEYMGKLELNWLKFCDTILDLPSYTIQEPPRNFEYYDSKTQTMRTYMPDFYMPDYNLIVEIKDGGNHPNGNKQFNEETKYKVSMKDDAMRSQNEFNYIRISGTNYGPFIETLYQIVHEQSSDNKTRKNIIVINESACGDITDSINWCDIDNEEIDIDRIRLLLCYIPNTYIPKYIAITDSKFLNYWYIYDMTSNTLSRQQTNSDIFDMYDYRLYKYIHTDKKDNMIAHVFKTIAHLAENNINDDHILNILTLLGEGNIFFDDKMCTFNNTLRRSNFVLCEEYKYSNQEEN